MSNRRHGIGVSLSPRKSGFGPLLFAGDLDRGLERCKELGYDGVELSLLDSAALDQNQLIDKIGELGLEVYSIATGQSYIADGLSLYSGDGERRGRVLDRLKDHIDFAARLGCAVILGGIRGKIGVQGPEAEERRGLGVELIRQCAAYAENREVVLLLEPINRYETDVVNTAREGSDLIEECGCDNVKLLLDTFHMNIEEPSIEESLEKAAAYLGYVHFADSNRYAPGMGHIPYGRIVEVLGSVGYGGPIVLEILPVPDDDQAAMQGITYMNSLLGQGGPG